MTSQPSLLIAATCVYFVALAATIYFTRATARRAAGALIGGVAVGAAGVGIEFMAHTFGWWRYPSVDTPYGPPLLYPAIVFMFAMIALIGWRVTRRFRWRGQALFLGAIATLGTFRDYIWAALSPEFIVFAPGIQPMLVDAACWAGLTGLAQAVMRLVSGPVRGDSLLEDRKTGFVARGVTGGSRFLIKGFIGLLMTRLYVVILLLAAVFWFWRDFWSEQWEAYEMGTVDVAAENYGYFLPEIDRVELSILGSGAATATNGFPAKVERLEYIQILSQKTIVGDEAREIGKKWKAMRFGSAFSAMCHDPAYGLRFFDRQKLVLETTFCWACSNFEVPTPLGYKLCGFDKEKPEAKALWELLQKHAPLPVETKPGKK